VHKLHQDECECVLLFHRGRDPLSSVRRIQHP
jgi:hypothetical protein